MDIKRAVAVDIGRSSTLTKFVSKLRYLAAFSHAGGSNSSNVENEAKVVVITENWLFNSAREVRQTDI